MDLTCLLKMDCVCRGWQKLGWKRLSLGLTHGQSCHPGVLRALETHDVAGLVSFGVQSSRPLADAARHAAAFGIMRKVEDMTCLLSLRIEMALDEEAWEMGCPPVPLALPRSGTPLRQLVLDGPLALHGLALAALAPRLRLLRLGEEVWMCGPPPDFALFTELVDVYIAHDVATPPGLLEALCRSRSLTALRMGCVVSFAPLVSLSLLRSLHCIIDEDMPTHTFEAELDVLGKLESLTDLSLDFDPRRFTGQGLSRLGQRCQLDRLNLSGHWWYDTTPTREEIPVFTLCLDTPRGTLTRLRLFDIRLETLQRLDRLESLSVGSSLDPRSNLAQLVAGASWFCCLLQPSVLPSLRTVILEWDAKEEHESSFTWSEEDRRLAASAGVKIELV